MISLDTMPFIGHTRAHERREQNQVGRLCHALDEGSARKTEREDCGSSRCVGETVHRDWAEEGQGIMAAQDTFVSSGSSPSVPRIGPIPHDTPAYYIYGLVDSQIKEVFYVGCTTRPNRRLISHRSLISSLRAVKQRVATMQQSGFQPSMVVLEITGDELREGSWIEYLREQGITLVNVIVPGRKLPKYRKHIGPLMKNRRFATSQTKSALNKRYRAKLVARGLRCDGKPRVARGERKRPVKNPHLIGPRMKDRRFFTRPTRLRTGMAAIKEVNTTATAVVMQEQLAA